ncbi:MAG: hypothetical protein WC485_00990 [Opitutaceae bacterium]
MLALLMLAAELLPSRRDGRESLHHIRREPSGERRGFLDHPFDVEQVLHPAEMR